MKYLILIITLFLFTSCVGTTEEQVARHKNTQPAYIKGTSIKDSDYPDIYYFQDTRTGFCFAERGRWRDYSFTTVDCDKVKEFIK